MKDWLFREKSYKKALERLIEDSPAPRGMISRIADAIGCQRSYLSQVLHSKVQLTKDQAWNICSFFDLTPPETKYFELLVDFERASSPAYRKHLSAEMEKLRKDASKLSPRFADSTSFTDAEAVQYFANWLPCAAHVLSSIPEYQDGAKMAARLGVSATVLNRTLGFLRTWGMVKLHQGKWQYAGAPKFVSAESPYVCFHHQNWRQLAVEDARDAKSEGVHFTMAQSMSREDFEAIKSMVLEFIEKTRKVADPSPPEVITSLNIDFFEPR
ncbi:MAG: TIGR02147 family protein [Bdellovibrionota bacterium]